MDKEIIELLGKPEKEEDVQIEPKIYSDSEENAVVPIDNDEELKKQNVLDRKLNRQQRYKIAKKIFWMMVIELIVIGCLLWGLFLVPYFNALKPRIIINLPPIFLTFSLIICYIFISRYIDILPDIYITSKKMHLKKTKLKTNIIVKTLCIIGFFILINFFPRKTYYIFYETIQLSTEITNLILYTSIAVFVKTTILGKDIIKTLYELMKQHHLN